jgi:hypothetical protein
MWKSEIIMDEFYSITDVMLFVSKGEVVYEKGLQNKAVKASVCMLKLDYCYYSKEGSGNYPFKLSQNEILYAKKEIQKAGRNRLSAGLIKLFHHN